jgi:predicted dehydrogenase
VDANTGILLGYSTGAVALLHCGLVARSPQTATVIGTKGRVEVASPFFRPAALTLHRDGVEPETFTLDVEGHGYGYQAQEVARCLRAGELESPQMPLDESVAIAGTLDTVADRLRA